jgi:hypothetical protein
MSRAAWFNLSLFSMCLAAVTAHGQTGYAPPAAPAQGGSPVTGAGWIAPEVAAPTGPQLGTSAVQPTPSATTPEKSWTAAAAPPPEPAMPIWGDYTRPAAVPLALPAVAYDLAGPPRGFVQPGRGQEYRQIVVDPNSLPAIDEGLTQGIDLFRPDGLAPIGVRADHTLGTGQALLSFRYDQSSFDDLFSGSHRVSTASALANFPFAPRRLFQNHETALLEYAPSDDFTMMMTLPFEHSRLDYAPAGGGNYTTAFGQPGDVTITGLYVLFRRPGQQLHVSFGLNTPTGFLDYLTVQPSPAFPNIPYVIRTSSGTFDLLPGLTYRGQNEHWTWGAQGSGTVHLGLNGFDYEVGDQVDLTAWLSRRWGHCWGTSARIDWQAWGNVRGADPRLDTTLAPTNRPDMQGGTRLNMLFGLNFYLPENRIPGQLFSLEVGVPVFQSLDGPQLGLDWALIVGWNMIL